MARVSYLPRRAFARSLIRDGSSSILQPVRTVERPLACPFEERTRTPRLTRVFALGLVVSWGSASPVATAELADEPIGFFDLRYARQIDATVTVHGISLALRWPKSHLGRRSGGTEYPDADHEAVVPFTLTEFPKPVDWEYMPFLLRASDLDALPDDLGLPSPRFVLFIAMDARPLTDSLLMDLARWAFVRGVAYVCTWGDDCHRVHHVFDSVREELDFGVADEGDGESVIMTTWHEDESLAEALWWAAEVTTPVGVYAEGCESLLVLVVDDWRVGVQVERYLGNPASLDTAR